MWEWKDEEVRHAGRHPGLACVQPSSFHLGHSSSFDSCCWGLTSPFCQPWQELITQWVTLFFFFPSGIICLLLWWSRVQTNARNCAKWDLRLCSREEGSGTYLCSAPRSVQTQSWLGWPSVRKVCFSAAQHPEHRFPVKSQTLDSRCLKLQQTVAISGN